jgi:hypothetical protein
VKVFFLKMCFRSLFMSCVVSSWNRLFQGEIWSCTHILQALELRISHDGFVFFWFTEKKTFHCNFSS